MTLLTFCHANLFRFNDGGLLTVVVVVVAVAVVVVAVAVVIAVRWLARLLHADKGALGDPVRATGTVAIRVSLVLFKHI